MVKNNAGADGRNRRALGDIGNVVTVRGIDAAKPNRPITRLISLFSLSLCLVILGSSLFLFLFCLLVFFCPFRSFCAQLLANAQAQAAADNNKVNFYDYL